MRYALMLAERAAQQGEVPVGAVVVRGRRLLGEGWNQSVCRCDPTAHAEIVALRQAALQVGNYRLPGSTLYVTLEPCAMCVGAIAQARLAQVVFGAYDNKAGAAGSAVDLRCAPALHHSVVYEGGILEESCAALLRDFFRARRAPASKPKN